jgi:hypothetical protein
MEMYSSQWENTLEMNIRPLIHGVSLFSDMILLTVCLHVHKPAHTFIFRKLPGSNLPPETNNPD